MTAQVTWGILGTGYAARQFAVGLQSVANSTLAAVCSRSQDRANRFAREFGCEKAFDSYAKMVADPAIDVIFIGSPNNRHRDDCIVALEADKAVVCEKPFTVNAREAREVIEVARRRNRFCMEAMWTRFMPAITAARRAIADGAIGDVCMVNGVVGHRVAFDPDHRLFAPSLGGGALLDLGVYAISIATFLIRQPAMLVASDAKIGESGVDEDCALTLRFPDGEIATLGATLRAWPPGEMTIAGTQGHIRIHAPLYRPEGISVVRQPGALDMSGAGPAGLLEKIRRRLTGQPAGTTDALPVSGNGAGYQAAEAAACIRAGRIESDVMSLADTLATTEIMDAARREWGLAYPFEGQDS